MTDPAAPKQVPVRISFASLRRSADNGVARASVFLGLMANATDTAQPVSHVLEDRMQYRFVPDEVPTEIAEHFVEEFRYWVIGNALRELVEAFSTFLTRCRPVLHLLEGKPANVEELGALEAAIERKNVSEQYKEIDDLANLAPNFADMLETFRRARNCLAHRRGIVAQNDVNTADGHLKLSWCFMGTFLQSPDGTEQPIDNDTIEQIAPSEHARKIVAHLTWKEKMYPVGSQIKLTRHDLGEICWGVHLATGHVVTRMRDFARAHGIPDSCTNDASDAVGESGSALRTPESLDRGD